ncbi:choice-of-anchor Q domain-containing protein, partial [Planktothrix mougeotii]|uniref:choice-of-anchor Q domain-containing protein n=1 Tax=Planktothrix mougeotii TaxID=54306 RepID=UPI002AD371D7
MAELFVINNQDSGAGSLRDTINQAQSGDIIKFNPTLFGGNTITLTTGKLDIPVGRNLIIDGIDNPNLIISGNNQFTVFYLNSTSVNPTSLTLQNLTINNGYTSDRGGGVSTTHQGILTIDNVKFNDNIADKGGGAIFSAFEGNLTVNNSEFNRNKAIAGNDERGAGAIAFWGPRNITVTNSQFSENEGINGAAINSLNGKLTIENSTFLNNKTTAAVYDTGKTNPSLRGSGGAVFADRASAKDEPSGTIRIVNSRFEGNMARGQGGAANLFAGTQDNIIFDSNVFINNQVLPLPGGNNGNGGAVVQTSNGLNQGFTINNTAFINNTAANQGGGIWMMDAPTTITNSTFSGNRAEATTVQGNGGAMALYGPTNIINTTIADNYAGWAGGGVSAASDETVTVQNTIFYNNTANNGGNSWNILQHTNRTFSDLGGNIQWPGNPNQTGNQYDATTNIVKVDPQLGTLQNVNGTYFYPLLIGSPAIDTGVNNSLTTDQKNQPRPIDGDQNGTLIIDSGAYEFTVTPTPS